MLCGEAKSNVLLSMWFLSALQQALWKLTRCVLSQVHPYGWAHLGPLLGEMLK